MTACQRGDPMVPGAGPRAKEAPWRAVYSGVLPASATAAAREFGGAVGGAGALRLQERLRRRAGGQVADGQRGERQLLQPYRPDLGGGPAVRRRVQRDLPGLQEYGQVGQDRVEAAAQAEGDVTRGHTAVDQGEDLRTARCDARVPPGPRGSGPGVDRRDA